jgi:hypothetical protein
MDDEARDHLFQVPLPPPVPPPGAVYFWQGAPRAEGEERESEDIMLRRVPREVAGRFRAAAGARNLTHAQYLTALVALHAQTRSLAEAGDEQVAAELDRLGLSSVTV